jgi:NAD(P)-dependent dehydrogenase (short-subunit alcohol dehydrogenase family)
MIQLIMRLKPVQDNSAAQMGAKFKVIPERFRDQVALVVGGAQGIGKAIALRLAREGALVVIGDVDRPMLLQTKEELEKEHLAVRTYYCDVQRQQHVDKMMIKLIRWYGRIDVLMYVAGIAEPMPFVETDTRSWDRTLDVNLKGAFLTARATIHHMVRQKSGSLIFLSSTNAWDAEASLASYNASKAGIFLLAKTLAREFGHYGIRSNAVGPGLIRTRLTEPLLKNRKFMSKYRNLIPLGRIGEPEDVVGPATFLASRDADFVNGILLFVDGGQLA